MTNSLTPIPETPLGKELAKHLLGRSTMGAVTGDVLRFAGYTITEALDALFMQEEQPGPPLQVFGTDPNVPIGETWVNAALDGSIRFLRKKSLRSWWIGAPFRSRSRGVPLC